MGQNIPTSTSELDAAWITDALRAAGSLPAEGSVLGIELVQGAAGIGFMGEVGKVSLSYEGDSGVCPPTMMAKFPSASPEVRTMMHPTRVFEREHRFYETFASRTPVRTPDVYHVTCEVSEDPMSEQYFLLMEDLGHLTLGDQVAGVSPDQAASALTGLARHHAAFWNGAGLQDAPFIPPINSPMNKAGQAIYEASLPGFREVFGHVLRPELEPVLDAFGARHPGILDELAAMPTTIAHLDYRADNLFFDDEGSVAVIDWQSISAGGGAVDVGYFMSQNLSVEDRRAHEQDLFRLYHDTLVANGVSDYSFEQLLVDFKVGVAFGLVIPVFAVGSLDPSSERAMALWGAVLERLQATIFDHGVDQVIV
ncbi:MAG: hypothetical protein ACJAXA_001111 [Candidatus Aldehydirespiratoraceae bacterium]|jgi:hypothetical protein